MHDLQVELDAMDLDIPVQIIGVNDIGYESGNDSMSAMGDLPWVQATVDQPVWSDWSAGFRDIVILDTDNVEIDRFNVTANDLSNPDNYAALRDLLVDYATAD